MFFYNILFSQVQFVERYDPFIQFVESTPVKCKFPQKLKTVILEQTFDGNETNYVKNFDEYNRIYEFHSETEGKNEHASYTCNYGEGKSSIGTYTYYLSNGDVDFKIVHEINQEGKPVKQEKISGKGKLLEEVTWEYNNKGNLILTSLVEGSKKQAVNQWLYQYDENGKLIKTVLKDSKDKIEHEWIYKSNEEQSIMIAGKDQTFINTWTETKDEFYLENDQRFDEKGGELHHIWRYFANDTSIEAYLVYDETNKLVFKEEYDHNIDKPLLTKEYEDGKVDNKGVYKYEDSLMTNYSEYDSKNELIEHHLYIYNDEGFMTRARIYDDKNKNEKTIVIKYKTYY